MCPLPTTLAARLPQRPGLRITVLRAGGLGDTLLTFPALQMLHSEFAPASLTLVGSAWAVRVATLAAFPLRVRRFDSAELTFLFRPGATDDPTGLVGDAEAVVVYTEGSTGELTANARRLCAGPVIAWPVRPEGGRHAAVHFARAIAEPGPGGLPPPALRVPAELAERADGWLASRFGGRATPVAVHPGSGSPGKCWPPERFARLIADLSEPILVVGGPADAEVCGRVKALLGEGCSPVLAEDQSVAELAALLARCSLYVGNDSGVSHLAAALGVPTIAVFGPTDPAVWAPRGPAVEAVASPEGRQGWPKVGAVLEALHRLRR